MRGFVVILGLVLLLVGCSDQIKSENVDHLISEDHMEFLSTYGWTIESLNSEQIETVKYNPELLRSLKNVGVDLEPYKGNEMKITVYTLKEKQENGDIMNAVIFEVDGKVIGGHGSLDNWYPGYFSLEEKERLLK